MRILCERSAHKTFQNKNVSKRNPKIGDVIMIYGKLTKQATWRLGKIVKTLPSESDGQMRAAAVQVSNGNIQVRPLKDLFLSLIHISEPTRPY